jgi:ribosomal-protein-alanine N-acetyltransferase
MNADPRVMEHFPSVLSAAESDAMMRRAIEHFERHGFGPWAVEVEGRMVGFVGLLVPTFEAHFTPAVEVAWRLAPDAWGFGYATEAAREVLRFAFDRAGLDEVVSFTVPANVRSIAVMERLGMTRDAADDFDHPGVAVESRLRRHVLYRLAATDR